MSEEQVLHIITSEFHWEDELKDVGDDEWVAIPEEWVGGSDGILKFQDKKKGIAFIGKHNANTKRFNTLCFEGKHNSLGKNIRIVKRGYLRNPPQQKATTPRQFLIDFKKTKFKHFRLIDAYHPQNERPSPQDEPPQKKARTEVTVLTELAEILHLVCTLLGEECYKAFLSKKLVCALLEESSTILCNNQILEQNLYSAPIQRIFPEPFTHNGSQCQVQPNLEFLPLNSVINLIPQQDQIITSASEIESSDSPDLFDAFTSIPYSPNLFDDIASNLEIERKDFTKKVQSGMVVKLNKSQSRFTTNLKDESDDYINGAFRVISRSPKLVLGTPGNGKYPIGNFGIVEVNINEIPKGLTLETATNFFAVVDINSNSNTATLVPYCNLHNYPRRYRIGPVLQTETISPQRSGIFKVYCRIIEQHPEIIDFTEIIKSGDFRSWCEGKKVTKEMIIRYCATHSYPDMVIYFLKNKFNSLFLEEALGINLHGRTLIHDMGTCLKTFLPDHYNLLNHLLSNEMNEFQLSLDAQYNGSSALHLLAANPSFNVQKLNIEPTPNHLSQRNQQGLNVIEVASANFYHHFRNSWCALRRTCCNINFFLCIPLVFSLLLFEIQSFAEDRYTIEMCFLVFGVISTFFHGKYYSDTRRHNLWRFMFLPLVIFTVFFRLYFITVVLGEYYLVYEGYNNDMNALLYPSIHFCQVCSVIQFLFYFSIEISFLLTQFWPFKYKAQN